MSAGRQRARRLAQPVGSAATPSAPAHPTHGFNVLMIEAAVLAIGHATGGAVPPRHSLREFAAVLHEFDLLLTPDTAAVHLAAAFKLPTVALYQPVASRGGRPG